MNKVMDLFRPLLDITSIGEHPLQLKELLNTLIEFQLWQEYYLLEIIIKQLFELVMTIKLLTREVR